MAAPSAECSISEVKKLAGLANGVAATDAATKGQLTDPLASSLRYYTYRNS